MITESLAWRNIVVVLIVILEWSQISLSIASLRHELVRSLLKPARFVILTEFA